MDELPVIFRVWRGEVCAYFPTLLWARTGEIACYVHVGQHGGAAPDFLWRGRPAKPEEFADLLAELRGIYESEPDPVRLKVYKRATGKANRRLAK